MHPETIAALRARTASITERWAALLQVELIVTPLANPDVFAYLIADTFEEIFARLARVTDEAAAHARPAECPGRCNPYKGYYIAAERALTEALRRLHHAEQTHPQRRESELRQLHGIIQMLASADVDAFCGVCTFRGTQHICRHVTAPALQDETTLGELV